MKLAKLSALSTKKTAIILRSEFLILSPCVGLLTLNSSRLIANIRTYKAINHDTSNHELLVSTNLGKFVKEIFHQREEATNIFESLSYKRRYGPLAIANSRSLPLYWLSVEGLGQILGISLLSYYKYDVSKLIT